MLGHLRVLLVEDASLSRDSLAALLRTEAGVEVIGAVANSVQAVRLATGVRPDLVIVDFTAIGGAETVAALHDRWPSAQALVLTSWEDDRLVRAAFRAGVGGYLLRSDSRAELMTAKCRQAIVMSATRYTSA